MLEVRRRGGDEFTTLSFLGISEVYNMANQNLAKVAERVKKVKEEVAAQCVQDADFRAALLKNPKAALAEEYGLEPSFFAKFNVRVVAEEPNELVITIPAAAAEGELSDDQLEAVAGGAAFIAAVGAVAGVIGAAAGAGAIVQNTRAGRRW